MRFRTATRAQVHVESELEGGGARTLSGTAANVSLKGVYFLPDRWLPIGVDCQVTIRFPGPEPTAAIRAGGRVTRSDARGIGIEFSEMDAESYEHLRALIRYHAADLGQVDRELEASPDLRPQSSPIE